MRFISYNNIVRAGLVGFAVIAVGFFIFSTQRAFLLRFFSAGTARAAFSYGDDWCQADTVGMSNTNRNACAGSMTSLQIQEIGGTTPGRIIPVGGRASNEVAAVPLPPQIPPQDYTNPTIQLNSNTVQVIGTTTWTPASCIDIYGLGVSNVRVYSQGPGLGFDNFQTSGVTGNLSNWRTPMLTLTAGATIPMKASAIIGHMNDVNGNSRGTCNVAVAEWVVKVPPIGPVCQFPLLNGTACTKTNICGMASTGVYDCNGICSVGPPSDLKCPQGALISVDCLAGIFGTEADSDFSPGTVHIYGGVNPVNGSGGSYVTGMQANSPIPYFSQPIPPLWKDGVARSYTAYGINMNSSNLNVDPNVMLGGSPKAVAACTVTPTGTFTANCSQATVTTSDPQSPGTPVAVEIYNVAKKGDPGSVLLASGNTSGGSFTATLPAVTGGNSKTYTLFAYAKTTTSAQVPVPTPQSALTLTCNPPPPSVTLYDNGAPVTGTITVPYNSSHTITWNSPSALSCFGSANGGASGQIFSGQLISPTPTTYTMTCSNAGGGGPPASVTIGVTQPPAPTVTLSAAPVSIPYNSASVLTWNPANATRCTASNGWTGSQTATAGPHSLSTGTLTSTTTYTITCYNATNVASVPATVTVTVNPPPPPTASITGVVDPDYCGASGAGMTINWQYSSAALPMSAYQIQLVDAGGQTDFDTNVTPMGGNAAPFITNGQRVIPATLDFGTNYVIKLTVWDSTNQPSTTVTSNHATFSGPWVKVPMLGIDPPKPAAGQPVTFTDTVTTYDATTMPTLWKWDFGDGTTGNTNSKSTTHIYAAAKPNTIIKLETQNGNMTPTNAFCSTTKSFDVAKPIPGYREVRP